MKNKNIVGLLHLLSESSCMYFVLHTEHISFRQEGHCKHTNCSVLTYKDSWFQ